MHSYINPFHQAHCSFAVGPDRPGGRRGRSRHNPGPRHFGRGGRRARRGDVRTALLRLLAEEPRNGYGLMQEIERRSEGAWRPSPGSVYPLLQQLEEEGLIRAADRDGQRVHEITDAGREELEQHPEAPAPWEAVQSESGGAPRQLMHQVRELATAAAQLVRVGDEAQIAQAQEVLRNARRSLYRVLAEDAVSEESEGPEEV